MNLYKRRKPEPPAIWWIERVPQKVLRGMHLAVTSRAARLKVAPEGCGHIVPRLSCYMMHRVNTFIGQKGCHGG